MRRSTRFLPLLFGAAILLAGASGIAQHNASAAIRAVSATGIGWDSGTAVNAVAAPASNVDGIGWD